VAAIITIQFTIIALGPTAPFRLPNHRRLEYFNETVTLIWCYHMFIFTDFVPDREHRYQAGFILVAVVGFCLVVNLLNLYLPIVSKYMMRLRNILANRHHKMQARNKPVKKVKIIDQKRVRLSPIKEVE
jgi:hypothetical protein